MLFAGGYDLSGAAFSVSIYERANSGAARLLFSLPKSMRGKLQNGDKVCFASEGKTLFCGYIFAMEETERFISITALDSLRYLAVILPLERKAETTAAFAARAVKAVGSRAVCSDMEDNGVISQEKRFGKITVLKAIYDSISDSVKAGGERLILRDEGGKIILKRESSLMLPLILGNDGRTTGFVRRFSIGDDAANYVKVMAENQNAGMRIAAVARNDEMMAKWGLLSKTVSGKGEAEVLLARAGNILAESCRESEEISISAKGDASVRAGSMLSLALPGENCFTARVTECSHIIRWKNHVMKLKAERV